MNLNILLIGRVNCIYSKRLFFILKKLSKRLDYFESSKRGEKLNSKFLKKSYDYVFCFRSYLILKENFIKKIKIAAVNFHPGPPNYRGTGCLNYALYDRSQYYGCTAHLINDKIDSGNIIDVHKFKIYKKDTLQKILDKTHKKLFYQASSLIKGLIKNNNLNQLIKENKHILWSGKIRNLNELDNFYEIKLDSSKREFENKIRSTYTKKFKPYLRLHGKKFILE